jgi:hypothetical protein
MKPARRFENQLDRLVEGIAARAFPGRRSADEVLLRLIQAAESGLRRDQTGHTAPNHFTIRSNIDDGYGLRLAAGFENHAVAEGWRLEGPVVVEVAVAPDLRDGQVDVTGKIVTGPLTAWGYLAPVRGNAVPLRYNRTLVGRSSAADVRLDDPDVSRSHALLWRSHGHCWMQDLVSTNGTYLNNTRIFAPAQIDSGDRLTFGPLSFAFSSS